MASEFTPKVQVAATPMAQDGFALGQRPLVADLWVQSLHCLSKSWRRFLGFFWSWPCLGDEHRVCELHRAEQPTTVMTYGEFINRGQFADEENGARRL